MYSLVRTSARPVCALLVVVCAGTAAAQIPNPTAPIAIDVNSTYLRTQNDPGATPAAAILLSSRGIQPGDWVWLQRTGAYSARNTPGFIDDNVRLMIGVFSATSELLPAVQLERIPQARDAGSDHATPATYHGSLPTDIGQDFFIDDVTLQVPAGALYLFACPEDSYYSDNVDPNGDYGLILTRVPEPATAVFSALGMGILGLLERRRRL